MKIAFLGTRGIPASYSGFETCVEELGKRLVRRGHDVTVYCRSHHIDYAEPFYEGIRLIRLTTLENKYLDTLVHSFRSSIHALGQGYDICMYFIAGNSPVTWIPRLAGQKTILNVDGLDWRREKWPGIAKSYIKFAERLATILPNAYLTDSRSVQQYYLTMFGDNPFYVPYGSDIEPVQAGPTLEKFNLEPREYLLFVGRLVPENRVEHLIEAYLSLETSKKCVIVGDAPYADEYQKSLRSLAAGDPRVVFTGYVFGSGYRELSTSASIFVETSGVGGTHPAILEAMALGSCVVVNNTQENLETIGETGFSYYGGIGASSLAEVLRYLLENPDRVEEAGLKARERANRVYSWESITDAYESLFHHVSGLDLPDRLRHVTVN